MSGAGGARHGAMHGGGPALGMALMVAAMVSYAVSDTIAKYLTQAHDGVQVTWARYFFHALAMLPLLWLRGPRALLTVERPLMQVARATVLLLSALCAILAFAEMAVAEVSAIVFVAPLLIVALSAPLLGERIGPARWAAVAAGFAGMVLIVWPSGSGIIGRGAIVAFLGAVFWAAALLITRQVRNDTALATLFYTAIVGAILISIVVPFFWTWPTPAGWAWMVVLGLFGGLSNLLLIAAFFRADASVLAPFNYTHLLWAGLFGWIVFDDVLSLRTLAGAAVIVAAGLFVWQRERLLARTAAA